MRADRLMSMMILLQNRGKMTAKELASELEVSERTIIRDMDALTNAGIPIVSHRGKEGGWQLLDNFRSKLSGLNIDDMKALFLFPSGELLEDLGLNNQLLDTRQKLLAAIPAPFRDEAQAMWERIYIDSGTWKQSKEKKDALQTVQEAIWDNKKLNICYEQLDGEQKERLIEPLGLVAKGSKWYLVAVRDGELRNYRVSRIHRAKVENETFCRPDQFNLATYWEQSKVEFVQNLPKYEVQVEIHPEIMRRIHFTGKFVEVMEVESSKEDRWGAATLRFNNEQEAIAFLLGFADKIKVISPQDLPGKVVAGARSVVEFYNKAERA